MSRPRANDTVVGYAPCKEYFHPFAVTAVIVYRLQGDRSRASPNFHLKLGPDWLPAVIIGWIRVLLVLKLLRSNQLCHASAYLRHTWRLLIHWSILLNLLLNGMRKVIKS